VNRPKFARAILDWYKQNKRDLPWRRSRDPYVVWVSEVMLQQTRVDTVLPYFERWMQLFPTIHDLARVTQQEVLIAWEGLGYYSRARNLHRAAQIIVRDMDGKIPSDPRDLLRLPGIGRYTAGAISSIAFGLNEPVLDANINRVFARVFDLTIPVRSSQGMNTLWKLAETNLPPAEVGEYNQGLMELGATVCHPHVPACPGCPVKAMCQSYALGTQEERPVSQIRKSIPHHTVAAAVIARDCRVLIAQRPPKGLLGGLWEFPGGKQEPDEDLAECLKREIEEELGVRIDVQSLIGVYRHAYTHFRVTLHAFRCCLANGDHPQAIQVNALRWVSPTELPDYPMGKLDRCISREIQSLEVIC
jgi:A/G-specific adenine glycosylase